jgi:hypothetical protein
LTVTADRIVCTESDSGGYTVEGLEWTPYDEPDSDATFPQGYKVSGTVTFSDGYIPSKLDVYTVDVGERAVGAWYISADGKSRAWGGLEVAYRVAESYKATVTAGERPRHC